MILYGSSVSPFVRKVLAYAAEKGIALEFKGLGLGSTDEGFLAASPFRKMPAFSDGDYTLADSSAIVQYLEALHPSPELIPVDPKQRGKTIWYDEFADTIAAAAMGAMFFNRIVSPKFLGVPGDEAAAQKAQTTILPPVLDYLEGVIPPSGFLVDDRLTRADLAVASPFVNLAHCGYDLDAATHPKLVAYVAAMLARSSFADWIRRENRMLAA